MVTLKQMEALVWIDRLGSFEAAAGQLNTSQSAISKRVKELEAACGVVLFDRSRRDARLTEDGRHMLGLGRQMLDLRTRAQTVKQLRDVPTSTLKLGVTEFTAFTWLPQLVARLSSAFPKTTFEPRVEMSRTLVDLLANDEIDLAILPDVFGDPEMTTVPLSSLANVWMASPLLVPRSESPSLKDVSRYTVLVQGKRSAAGVVAQRWLRRHGAEPRSIVICDNLIAQLGLAVAGSGLCCLPELSMRPLLKAGKLRVLADMEPPPPVVYAAMHRSERTTKFLRAVVAITKAECDFSAQLI